MKRAFEITKEMADTPIVIYGYNNDAWRMAYALIDEG